jgi:stearoyl-CoA 9-desaturase NADPH oxidoreductase
MNQRTTYQPHWIREDFIDFIGEKIDPLWAWKKVKAQIVAKQNLSQDFIQIELRPNQHFNVQQYQAGQSIALSVRINGVYQQRQYSIVNVFDNGDITIAVKQQGLVSHALTALAVGAIVEISQAQGEFVLQNSVNPVLLLASGSGVTAIYALLKHALKQQVPHIELVYFTRDDAYHAEFKSLALSYPQFNYHHINTLEQKQHLTEEFLAEHIPQYAFSETYACGAAAMMRAIQTIYADKKLESRLHSEFFQLPMSEDVEAQPIKFLRSQQDFQATTTLLESAEQAGLKPKHGCRIGICNSCSCTKVSGSVRNVLTGDVDHQNNSQIKLCISQAISPVVINL